MSLLSELDNGLRTTAYHHLWFNAGYKPHKYQQQFHDSKARYRAIIAGVGSGKTLAGAAEVVRWALEQPGSRYLVCAATYPLLKKSTIIEVMRILDTDFDNLIEYYNKADNELKFKNGSMIWFVSMEDPDKQGRGPTVAGVWVDEGSYITSYAFTVLSGRIRQPGYQQGMWITTTPKGYNYLYDYFVDKPSKNPALKEDYWYVQFSTRENPYLTKKFIEGLEMTHAGSFALQEIEGKFVGFSGMVYPLFDPQIHLADTRDKQYKEILYFHDFGYTNPMVCLACGIDGDGRMYILEEFYETGKTLEELIAARHRMVEKYGRGLGIGDPSEPGMMESIARAGLPTISGDNSIIEGIQVVLARLQSAKDGKPRLFIDRSCLNTIKEFQMYRYPDNPDGKPVKDRPIKDYDHAMDALRYGVMYLDRRGGDMKLLKDSDLDRYI